MNGKLLGLIAIAAGLTAPVAHGAVIVLDFEGIEDFQPVGDFYNGAPDGEDFGIEFSPFTLALEDQDQSGSGNFANEPSPDTVLFFYNADNAILNFAAGFDTGFSFFYSSQSAASVSVYSGVNATGDLLATLNLDGQFRDNCIGDPTGVFCNWSPIGVTFAGIARSIDFAGAANQTGFDDITFGTEVAGGDDGGGGGGGGGGGPAVPEPATLALLGLGLAGLGAVRRRRMI